MLSFPVLPFTTFVRDVRSASGAGIASCKLNAEFAVCSVGCPATPAKTPPRDPTHADPTLASIRCRCGSRRVTGRIASSIGRNDDPLLRRDDGIPGRVVLPQRKPRQRHPRPVFLVHQPAAKLRATAGIHVLHRTEPIHRASWNRDELHRDEHRTVEPQRAG